MLLRLVDPRWHRDLLAPPPHGQVLAQAIETLAYHPLGPAAGATPGTRESRLGYRRIHGELLVLGVKVAASTVWRSLSITGMLLDLPG